jgi:hypothetical protein
MNAKRLILTLLFALIPALPMAVFAADTLGLAELRSSFSAQVQDVFGLDPKTVDADVAIYATRSVIAHVMEQAVNRSPASLKYEVGSLPAYSPGDVVFRSKALDDATMSCSRDDMCNWSCNGIGPGRLACEANKEFCKDSHKFDCERRKSMAQLISDKKLATVSFHSVSVSGNVTASRFHADIAPALDHITLGADLNANITVSASGTMNPEPLIAVLAGCIPHPFSFSNEPVEVHESGFAVVGSLSMVADGDHVNFDAAFQKPSVTLHFAGTPALRFIARNPGAFIACPIPYSIAGIADLADPKDMAKKDIDIPIPPQGLPIGAMNVRSNGWKATVTPGVAEKYVSLSATIVPDSAAH